MSLLSRKISTRFVKDEITFHAFVAWITVDGKNATPTTHVNIICNIILIQPDENMFFMTKMNDISLFINYIEWIFDIFYFFRHIFEF
ncbi:PREDICTED: uncharacterized protein LOC109128875 [Camelina sativa]|uniref:Uncharacterized protein LOC109128875 n=1 Tax=Camelina sativa TaxID=90675 RepID=A0ABM1QXV5_CAMSA|nr:PREDICTED: uncharacterized protein LOC109128875 [Camelina sativa]